MRRAALAAILAVITVGVIFDASEGSGLGPRLGIAYVRGTAGSPPQVWLAGPDGTGAQRLGPGTQPLLSPLGATVAATSGRRSGPALVLYPSDGASAQRFFDAALVTASPQAWSPDSRYLAVTLSSTDPLSDKASGLAVIDTEQMSSRIVAKGSIYGASFAHDGSDRLAYARAAAAGVSAPVDVYVSGADGGGAKPITRDGRSLYPVWGPTSIAFSHEQLRNGAAPVYQVWTMQPDGRDELALTDLRVPPLIDGLVPISFAGGGAWVLAQYQGQDTSAAWIVAAKGHQARPLQVGGADVTGAELSRDGSTALIDAGGFLNPPDQGRIEALPLAGGTPRVLIRHGSQPSWNL